MLNRAIILKSIQAGLEELGATLVKKVVIELENQGHKATGRLIGSVEAEVSGVLREVELAIKHFDYGVYVEYGVAANRVAYGNSSGGGGGSSAYIQALIKWVLVKRFTGSLTTAKGIAFAIAKTHKKEGIPTRNSYNFAKNGRRKFFMREVATRNERLIDRKVLNVSTKVITSALFGAIKNL